MKYVPCIFSFLLCGYKTMKISFQFSCPENAVLRVPVSGLCMSVSAVGMCGRCVRVRTCAAACPFRHGAKKQARAGGVLLRGLAVSVVFLSVPAAGRGCAWDSSDYEVEIVRRVCGYIGSFGFLGYAVHFYRLAFLARRRDVERAAHYG